LAKLRQMFFHGDQSLGQRTIRLTRQSEDSRYANFRENVRWTQGDVMFATLATITWAVLRRWTLSTQSVTRLIWRG
jgi:hypothetical protein